MLCERNIYENLGYKSVDCLNGYNFGTHDEKNCIFSHGPTDQPQIKGEAADSGSTVSEGQVREDQVWHVIPVKFVRVM